MDPSAAEHISKELLSGSFVEKFWPYLIWFIVTVLGSACGVWLRETIKGNINKDIWFSQENWKEKYRLYTELLLATEEIADSLWGIVADSRILPFSQQHPESTESDGIRAFPDHQIYLDRESNAIEKIATASVGVELMLNEKAKLAIQKIRSSRTQSGGIINISYWKRIQIRQEAATEAKTLLIEAAQEDLKI